MGKKSSASSPRQVESATSSDSIFQRTRSRVSGADQTRVDPPGTPASLLPGRFIRPDSTLQIHAEITPELANFAATIFANRRPIQLGARASTRATPAIGHGRGCITGDTRQRSGGSRGHLAGHSGDRSPGHGATGSASSAASGAASGGRLPFVQGASRSALA